MADTLLDRKFSDEGCSRLMSISCQSKNIKILAGFRMFLFLLERRCSLSTFVSLLSSSSGTRFNVNYVGPWRSIELNRFFRLWRQGILLFNKLLSSREFSFKITWYVVYTCFVLFGCFGVRRSVAACWTPCLSLIGSLTTKLFKLNCYCTRILLRF